jgi:hypothetical protein
MIRGLLADRFKLVRRVEQKRMPVYALTVASGGPNLQKSTIAEKDCVFDTGRPESCHYFLNDGRGHPLNARAANMDDLSSTSRPGQICRGEPHGTERPVRRGHRRLAPDATAAAAAGRQTGRGLRSMASPHSSVLNQLGLELARSDRAGIHGGAPRASGHLTEARPFIAPSDRLPCRLESCNRPRTGLECPWTDRFSVSSGRR